MSYIIAHNKYIHTHTNTTRSSNSPSKTYASQCMDCDNPQHIKAGISPHNHLVGLLQLKSLISVIYAIVSSKKYKRLILTYLNMLKWKIRKSPWVNLYKSWSNDLDDSALTLHIYIIFHKRNYSHFYIPYYIIYPIVPLF